MNGRLKIQLTCFLQFPQQHGLASLYQVFTNRGICYIKKILWKKSLIHRFEHCLFAWSCCNSFKFQQLSSTSLYFPQYDSIIPSIPYYWLPYVCMQVLGSPSCLVIVLQLELQQGCPLVSALRQCMCWQPGSWMLPHLQRRHVTGEWV